MLTISPTSFKSDYNQSMFNQKQNIPPCPMDYGDDSFELLTMDRQAQKKEKGTDSSAQIKSASDELKHLQDKFKGYSIVSADYRQGMQYGKSSTTNVAISPSFLKKIFPKKTISLLSQMTALMKKFANLYKT